jgi:carbon storage regulator
MLVLSRRLNEKLVLPEVGVTVSVLAVKGGSVRIGIEAPPRVSIWREEVLRRPGPAPPSRRRPGEPPVGG